jgi:acetate kinase
VKVLVFNAGSSSLKVELFDLSAAPPRRIASVGYADADGSGVFRWQGPTSRSAATARTLADAAGLALDWLSDATVHGEDLARTVEATAHRIVHGGARFRQSVRLQERELAELAELSPLAPLHNPPALAVVDVVRQRLGAQLPLVGVFDTAYYADLPPAAYRYAVPARWSDELGIRRYGFHGIAHRYMCQQVEARRVAAGSGLRVISLQLGRGCSVTASVGGRAVATSMGFTPLEGLVMGTRSGDIDAGAVLYVMDKTGMSTADVGRDLNQASGLLGLSGQSADMRELLRLASAGNAAAVLALEIFCRRARHYVGAYLAELGGADVIVFGGGIGENCGGIRDRIAGGLGWAGIAARQVEVVAVDEAAVIGADAYQLLTARP